jgi:hypothetical protein
VRRCFFTAFVICVNGVATGNWRRKRHDGVASNWQVCRSGRLSWWGVFGRLWRPRTATTRETASGYGLTAAQQAAQVMIFVSLGRKTGPVFALRSYGIGVPSSRFALWASQDRSSCGLRSSPLASTRQVVVATAGFHFTLWSFRSSPIPSPESYQYPLTKQEKSRIGKDFQKFCWSKWKRNGSWQLAVGSWRRQRRRLFYHERTHRTQRRFSEILLVERENLLSARFSCNTTQSQALCD